MKGICKKGLSVLLLAVMLFGLFESGWVATSAGAAEEDFVPYVTLSIEANKNIVKAPDNSVLLSVTINTNYDGRTARAYWSREGKQLPEFTNDNFILEDGKTSKMAIYVDFERYMTVTGTVVNFDLFYDDQHVRVEKYIAFHNHPDSYYAEIEAAQKAAEAAQKAAEAAEAQKIAGQIAQIETIRVEATIKSDTAYYSDMGLRTKKGSLSKGTTGIYNNYYERTNANGTKTRVAGRLQLSNGNSVWVPYGKLSISSKNYAREADYTTEQKVNFVNAKGYKSDTKYLVWINLKTQRVNLFSGEKGAWTLQSSYRCATGKNTTPTIAGVFKYNRRVSIWDFGSYYVKPVLVFNGGHAMHSRTYVKRNGSLLDATIGRPASAGCVRMYDADVQWLDKNLPMKSTVVVF